MIHFSTISCPFEMPDGDSCGGEIIIEWDLVRKSPQPTGRTICAVCERDSHGPASLCLAPAGLRDHQWVQEFEEPDAEQELVSYKTYCWHPVTKEQVSETLDEMALAAAERRAEA